MTPEGKIVQYIIKKAKEAGGTTRKIAYEGRAGAPDLLVLLPGCAFFIEAKREKGGRLSPAQEREIAILRRSGLLAFVCASPAAVDAAFEEAAKNFSLFEKKALDSPEK